MSAHEQAADIGAEAAREWADSRKGWELVSYRLIGLPYWRVRTRLRVLERKAVGPIDEYLLRSISLGIDQPEDLGALLGLDEPVLDAHLVELLTLEAIARKPGGLELTQTGRDLVAETGRVTSEIRTIDLDWDGLLRRPTAPLEGWTEPRELTRAGLREVQPSPARGPDLPEMRVNRDRIEAMLRQLTQEKDTFDLLDIGGVERRHRIYRPAVALAFRGESGPETQIAIAIEGRLSEEHEEAFARAGLAKRLGVEDRGLPSFKRQLGDVLPEVLESGQSLAPHQHRDVLDIALEKSAKRLLIWTPSVHAATLNRGRLGQLQALLERGVDVRIVVLSLNMQKLPLGPATENALRDLVAEHSNLTLGVVRRLGPSVLISDQRMLAAGGYDWLGQTGDVLPRIRDMSGRVVTDATLIDAAWERLSDQAQLMPKREERKSQRRQRPPDGQDRRVRIDDNDEAG